MNKEEFDKINKLEDEIAFLKCQLKTETTWRAYFEEQVKTLENDKVMKHLNQNGKKPTEPKNSHNGFWDRWGGFDSNKGE